MAARGNATTVIDVLTSVFPHGYLDYPSYLARLKAPTARGRLATSTRDAFDSPPCSAVDLFAMMGQLLLKSGAYHYVGPFVQSVPRSRMVTITNAQRRRWQSLGRQWRGDGADNLPAPPKALVGLWRELVAESGQRVFAAPGYTVNARKWWRPAIALFCIADEAALDIGFHATGKSAQARYIESPIRARQKRATQTAGKLAPSTLSRADQDLLCVLPKSRTPKVGCTIRSMSHNLALLPGRGQARAHWSLTPDSASPVDRGDPAPFNVVVLPMPFRIRANAFRAVPSEDGSWGWFDVEPHWCPPTTEGPPPGFEVFFGFVTEVLDRAASDCDVVHALVLPEVALSYGVFQALCERLKERSGFELLISGLFDGPHPVTSAVRSGNFAAMARFHRTEEGSGFDLSVRKKHHRWRLDRSQIETYALGSALDVNRGWWEHIDILGRSLDVFVLRGGATVTALICEDLARNDPCQELVRGIGPNFVVALLMDGPQRQDRWPARYATVLAEDPGSSVLSLTSFGLIRRTNEAGHHPVASQVGLFRDDTGLSTEIKLPVGAQAVCLTLQPTNLTEHTLDGRADKGDAQSWRLTAVQPVRTDCPNAAVMEGSWPANRD